MEILEADVIAYLKALLENCANYTISPQENIAIHEHGLENFIFDRITSPQFRKWTIPKPLEQGIKEKIRLSVVSSRPISIILPFGGYKLWHYPLYSEVSWSEYFAIAFYARYLAPISASYPPGVDFNFLTDDIIINSMDEVPKADVEKYFRSFHGLLTSFSSFFPANLRITIKKETSPVQTSAADSDNINDWYARLALRRGEETIMISCTPIPGAISLGSTHTSITMFWSGMGIIEQRPEGLVNRIVSKNIWEEIASLPHLEIIPNLIDLHNLSKILIYPEKFGIGKYHRRGDGAQRP